ncbi:MAG: peptide ABC transporter substrate-binding protein [Desulfobacterales bacterium]|nr:peptide ABC transporter substrate-binding protein [Desulfobacterales bacterium]
MSNFRGKNKKGPTFFLMTTILLISLIMLFMYPAPNAKAGGELRVGWLADQMASSLACNDAWQYEALGCILWQLLYDQAWHFDPPPEYEYSPRAITGYETKDNKNFTFHIREGMTFHDGKPVTAKDFAFTYENLPVSNPVWSYPSSQTVKDSLVVVDDHTLNFEMSNIFPPKYPPFDWVPILPEHLWRRHRYDMEGFKNAKGIGSGPFMLDSFAPGKYISFKNFEAYWEQKPRVDKIVFKTYGSQDAQVMAMKRGEVDMMGYGGVSPLAAKMLRNSDNIEIITSPGIALQWLTFNLYQEGPIQDLNIRKALIHAINKDRIVQMVYHGEAVVHDSFIYPERNEYNPNLPQYEFNVDISKKILDESGYMDTDGDDIRNDPKSGRNLSFKFLVPSSDTEEVKMATLMREQFKDIGIDIRLNVVDVDTYFDLVYYPQNPAWDISFVAEEPGPNASWIWEFSRSWNDGASMGWNTSYYDNPEFDELLNAFNREVDLEKAKAISYKMQEIVTRDLPYYIICRPNIIDPVRTDKLTGYVPYMGGIASWINPFSYFRVHAK